MSESFRPSPESAPAIKDTGPDSGTEKSEKKDTKKKSKLKARLLGGAAAEKVLEAPKEEKQTEAAPKSESLWQKIAQENTGKSPLVEESAEKELAAEEKSEEATEPQLETLSADEARETVRQYTEARLDDITGGEQSPDAQYETAAEDAADAALLESIQQKMAEDPERPLTDVLDEAELEVAETIQNQEIAEEPHQQEDRPMAGAEDFDRMRSETETVETYDTEATQEARSMPAGQPTPPVPPGGPVNAASGTVPPPGGRRAFTMTSFNTVPPAAASRAAERQLHYAERTAAARGLVVGGIVGYLIGKRRGRIKTEKQLVPVQEKLQKQVETLTLTVAAKEQRIRTLAAEKAAVLQNQTEKQRFAEHLRPAPAAEVVDGQPVRERPPKQGALHVERLGKIVVETPAILAGAGVGIAAERLPNKPMAVDFSKKAEAYNSEELKAASEKVRIDGVTLKEVQQTHNLDERAVRRIMKQYLEGGNVREALTKEIVEKELKYERDPRLRAVKTGSQDGSTGTAAVAGAAMLSLLGADTQDSTSDTSSKQPQLSNKGPTPDQATLAKLRRQQATELAAVSITIIVFFAVLIVLVV